MEFLLESRLEIEERQKSQISGTYVGTSCIIPDLNDQKYLHSGHLLGAKLLSRCHFSVFIEREPAADVSGNSNIFCHGPSEGRGLGLGGWGGTWCICEI